MQKMKPYLPYRQMFPPEGQFSPSTRPGQVNLMDWHVTLFRSPFHRVQSQTVERRQCRNVVRALFHWRKNLLRLLQHRRTAEKYFSQMKLRPSENVESWQNFSASSALTIPLHRRKINYFVGESSARLTQKIIETIFFLNFENKISFNKLINCQFNYVSVVHPLFYKNLKS